MSVKTNLPKLQPVIFLHPHQMHHTENRADKLGYSRCQGCRSHSHAKSCDKEDIQHHIHTGGNNQIDQRMAAVPHRLQDSNENIVHDYTQRTCKIGLKIYNRFRKYICRCSHQYQNLRCQIHSRSRQCDSGHQTEGCGCMNRSLEIILVFRPIIPGNYHTSSHGNTVNKTYHQENQISRRTDCCQRIAAKIITYNQGIRCIIQLLKQIPQKQWYGK